ncbi:cadherin repeat domain-containing protein, partial [Candidatus Bipolaricaulota bacterium]|nr:cadherin repeat domain-containing protein [Candidatus Bipolaricaulota bacterium]
APEVIPAIGTTEWTKSYHKTWKDSPTLQADHGTESIWRDSLVKSRQEQLDAIDDITDIHVGLYATAGTLDEANTIAVYYEMAKLLPQLSFRGYNDADVPDFPPQTYMFHAESGHWQAVNGMRGWTHVIRKGEVKNEFDTAGSVDMYNKKSNVNFYYNADYVRRINDGDPVHKVIRADPAWEAKLGTSQSTAGNTGVPGDVKALIEIQVQLTRGANPTYGEIRMWNYETTHIVTNDADSKIVTIRGNLGGKVTGKVEGPSVGAAGQSVTVNPGDTLVGTYGTNNIDIAWSVAAMYAGGMFSIGTMSGELNFNAPATPGIYYVKIVATDNGPQSAGAQSAIMLTITVLDAAGTAPTLIPWQPGWDKATCNANGYFFCPIAQACMQTTLAESAVAGSGATHEPGDADYEDLCYFPIGLKAAKKVPFFKRERLLRESVQLSIYSVKIVKLKWYQERWFSVVLTVISIIASVIPGWQGVAVAIRTMIVTLAIGLAVSILVKVISQFIDNPFLVAI